ncbi:MAG: rhombosortase [Cellvibrio sp. 79]|nr:MAG: rhombosortase [Cellvibrio sp. 79]
MKKYFSNPTVLTSVLLSVIILMLTLFESYFFNSLSLNPEKTNQGQYWRLLTANFVHFGWPHSLMNVAALILCTFALLSEISPLKYLCLLLGCCLTVGTGIYWLNPEYQPYAGLSGAIHGLIVAGILLTRDYPLWVRIVAGVILIGKLANENSGHYEANDLQILVDAKIAVESHLYGAVGGLACALVAKIFTWAIRGKNVGKTS